MNIELERDIKIDIINGKYKAISAYNIPSNVEKWLNCPNCGLKPLVWEYNNGRSTACGCGSDEYDHFSIWTESVMSHVRRSGGSVLNYDSDKLRKNWNHWVQYGVELEPRETILELGRW